MRYFHTFDALRFFAFFIVFLQHLPKKKSHFIDFFMNSGAIGVQIFFVLSGFLISYILLEEKKKSGHLNFRNFFIRRILRIWPLYYLMILFAFITPFILDILQLSSSASDEGYTPNWIFPLLFLENYEMMIKNSFANVSPLRVMWSLCVEEYFYILWGIIFYFISNKRIIMFLIISIILSLLFRIIYSIYNIDDLDINTNVLYFSFGGFLAYLLSYKESLINNLKKIPLLFKYFLAVIIVFIYFLLPFLKVDTTLIQPFIISIITAFLIAITLPEKNPLKISNKNIFNRLGKYTYGMYLFHTIWINLIIKFTSNFLIIFTISIIATIVSSILSYYLFENKFLKLKRFFI